MVRFDILAMGRVAEMLVPDIHLEPVEEAKDKGGEPDEVRAAQMAGL